MNTDRRLFLKYAMATSAVYQAVAGSAAGRESAESTGRNAAHKHIDCKGAFIAPEPTRVLRGLEE